MSGHITITIRGGTVAEVQGMPTGVQLLVKDYDVGDRVGDDVYTDADGKQFTETVFEHKPPSKTVQLGDLPVGAMVSRKGRSFVTTDLECRDDTTVLCDRDNGLMHWWLNDGRLEFIENENRYVFIEGKRK